MYLHGFHGVKHFRKELVTVESFEDVEKILGLIEKQTMLDGE
jgi:hypothetical protein